MIYIRKIGFLACLAGLLPGLCSAQGEDSTTWVRDQQVIRELLAGQFSNANQAYFDQRAARPELHRRLNVIVAARENRGFSVEGKWSTDSTFSWRLVLSPDDEARAVRMRLDDGAGSCDYLWYREAAQFRAVRNACSRDLPESLVLSDRQLWLDLGEGNGGVFELHRARLFTCHADLPGVGGGVAIPYDRYGEFELHDQGGQAWFTSKEGREIGISLLTVDWPLNNYDGVFTRDSFVMYLSEKLDGETRQLGYAFTIPDADRIGINLKWILAMCYMTSNRDARPSM